MVYNTPYELFELLHRPQLESSGIPAHFWSSLYRKLLGEVFDAGNVLSLVQLDYGEQTRGEFDPLFRVILRRSIKCDDPEQIYLIDHAWTFKVESARRQLTEMDVLRERLCRIVGVNNELSKDEAVDEVVKHLWKFANFYSVSSADAAENCIPIWYIMDELGCAIGHSDTPNFRVVPFVYVPQQITYSLLFPIVDVDESEMVCRDFVEGVKDEDRRRAMLLPWVDCSFEDVDFVQEPPTIEYFQSGHIEETLPDFDKLIKTEKKTKYKVFSEYTLVQKYLTDERYEIVDNEEQADILWYTKHFKEFQKLSESSEKFVNQFPFEYVLTVKDLLCAVCRRKDYYIADNLEAYPKWLPITYNLKTELTKFISFYKLRGKSHLDNHWIIKPFNLARGLDTYITSNLDFIIRLSSTGPKIAQKYITNPVLFHRPECSGLVKFDIRYVILLKSVEPLEAYVYRNFFLRFSNKPFEINDFDDYEKHFTVMNYTATAQLKHMLCDDFKTQWEQQYPSYPWAEVENSIFIMLKSIMESAVIESPPFGIAKNPQSRAVYAADIMLEWNIDKQIQPKILEVNWTPDCQRACEYYSEFYNDIFNLFFFDEEKNVFKML